MIQGRRWRPPVSPRETPGRLTPAGREAGLADASPVTLPVYDVSGIFFSDVIFLWLPCLLLFFFLFFFPFLSSPVYGFPGRPPGGAGCRERSQRSCLRLGGSGSSGTLLRRRPLRTERASFPALRSSLYKPPILRAGFTTVVELTVAVRMQHH